MPFFKEGTGHWAAYIHKCVQPSRSILVPSHHLKKKPLPFAITPPPNPQVSQLPAYSVPALHAS